MAFSLRHMGRYDLAACLTYIAYAGSSVAVPVVLVEIAGDLNFPLNSGGQGAGGALQISRSIFMVLAMVLCGFAAGRWGKRLTIGSSVIVMALGVGLAALAPSYGIIVLALAAAGFGEGIIEGLSTPVIQDLHRENEPGRYINFCHGFWSIGIVLMTFVTGLLLVRGVSWRYILAGVAAVSVLLALCFLLPEKRNVFTDETADFKTTWERTKQILSSGPFWIFFVLMFVGGGAEFGLTFWASSFVRLNLNGTAAQGAMTTLIFSAGMIAGRLGSAALIPQKHLFRLLLCSAGAGAAVSLALPFVHTLWLGMGLFLLLGVACAPLWPSTQSYCTDRLPRLDPTVVYIILSCAGTPGCGFVTWILGELGDRFTLRYSVLAVPVCLALFVTLLALERLRKGPQTER